MMVFINVNKKIRKIKFQQHNKEGYKGNPSINLFHHFCRFRLKETLNLSL